MSNRHPSITPYETFDTGTGPIVIATGNDEQFRTLAEVIGRADLAYDERFATNATRVGNRDVLVAEINAALRTRPAGDWLVALQGADVPCGPINTIEEAFALAKELGLDPVQEIASGGGSAVATVSNPIDLSRTPVSYRLAPPDLGSTGAPDVAAPGAR